HPDLHSFPTRRSSDLKAKSLTACVLLFFGRNHTQISLWRRTERMRHLYKFALFTALGASCAMAQQTPTTPPTFPGQQQTSPTRRSEEHTSELQSPYDL